MMMVKSSRNCKGVFLFVASLAMLAVVSGCGINNIPTYSEKAHAEWSQVLNQYKRRADLIPNLTEVVKGYAAHEKSTLQSVIEARRQATQVTVPSDILSNPEAFKAFEKSQNNLSGALSRLLVVSERYPDLKANQNFLTLQSQLEGSENRIAVARRDFIEAVRVYNTELRTFPGRIWRSFLYSDMKAMENFSPPDSVQDAPSVKF